MNQLEKRGFSLASRSPFCGQAEEVPKHLFIHCPDIWGLYTALFPLSEGGWVCPSLVKELILGWVRLPLKKKETKLWRAAPLCLLWAIWKERNSIVFEDERFSFERLKSFFFRSLCAWATMIPDGDSSFVRCPLCII